MIRLELPRHTNVAWLAALGLLALLAGGAGAQDAATQLGSTVSVHYLDASGALLRSTEGTLIKEGLLAPNSALAGAAKVEVIARGDRRYAVTGLLSSKPDVDLALLALDTPPEPALFVPKLSTFLPGGDVNMFRGPEAGDDQAIAAKTPSKFSLRGPEFVALTAQGSDGGPVFKASGEFIGVARRFDEAPYQTAYVVTIASIARLIEGARTPILLSELPAPVPPEFAAKTSVPGLVFRGFILIFADRTEDARNFLNLAMKREPENPDCLFAWGQLLMREKSYLDAAARFRQAAENSGGFHMAWHMAGVALNQAGRYQDAVQMYQKALEVDPKSAMTHCNLGGAYYNLGRLHDAVDEFEASRQIDPKYWLAYANLANTYAKMGESMKAEEVYQDVLAKNPELAAKLRKDLDAGR